jgi:leucine dehydrogenase
MHFGEIPMLTYEVHNLTAAALSAFPDYDGHEAVIRCEDPSCGLVAFVAIHDTALGPGMGGCRMALYASEADALRDALRLSRGMTYKYAAAGLNYGGAKAVILDRAEDGMRCERILAFARFVERLGGRYTTAEDAGISTADISLMSGLTRYVRNLPLDEAGDGALCTAWGVLHGIEAGLAFRGFPGLAGRTAAVEGLGKVGMTLCSLLREKGAGLVICDVNESRVAEAVSRHGAVVAPPGRIHAAPVDIYAPCALGGVLNPQTVPQIVATIVAGAANNQLSDKEQDAQLHLRGITYCPDYVVNAGGVLSVGVWGAAYDRDSALARVARIRATTAAVLALAAAEQIPPGEAADRLAARRLGRSPVGRRA